MVLRRNRLPEILFENGNRFRRPLSLGIANNIIRKKIDKEFDDNEDDMRLQRIGFNEKYFNNR